MKLKTKCIECLVVCSYCPFNYHCKEKKQKDYLRKQDNKE